MRLIDADALEKSILRWCSEPERYDSYNGVRCRACSIDDVLSELDCAPTIDVKPAVSQNTLQEICDDFGLTPSGVRYALQQYQKLITELTDGSFSKLTYNASLILDRARECFEKESVDAEPVRHGRWDLCITAKGMGFWTADAVCRNCGFTKPKIWSEIWSGHFQVIPSDIARDTIRRHAERVKLPNYCENCGAKMDGDSDAG